MATSCHLETGSIFATTPHTTVLKLRRDFFVLPQSFALNTPHWGSGLCSEVSLDVNAVARYSETAHAFS